MRAAHFVVSAIQLLGSFRVSGGQLCWGRKKPRHLFSNARCGYFYWRTTDSNSPSLSLFLTHSFSLQHTHTHTHTHTSFLKHTVVLSLTHTVPFVHTHSSSLSHTLVLSDLRSSPRLSSSTSRASQASRSSSQSTAPVHPVLTRFTIRVTNRVALYVAHIVIYYAWH